MQFIPTSLRGMGAKALSMLGERFPGIAAKADSHVPGESSGRTDESGRRPTPEDQIKYLYRQMWVDFELRATILDIRRMDRMDGRVKMIHKRVARDATKGGLVLQQRGASPAITRQWNDFKRRLQLDRIEKLKSDARGLVMEGSLPLQWVVEDDRRIAAAVRMPTETMRPNVGQNGRFTDLRRAYSQLDVMTGAELAAFPLWKLTMARFDPDNFDDLGNLGRPFLDASRSVWQKLTMTDEDLVIRRRMRAPLRMAHVLEGADDAAIEKYRNAVEADQAHGVVTDYYSNKKGGVTALQGDENLDQIKDIAHLLDTFFAGGPLPKGMMGFTDGLARDILEDLKRDYYDEIDTIQDTISYGYDQGWRLHLLLQGIDPEEVGYTLTFVERRTETLTQTTDRALKLKALGLPQGMVYEELGKDPAEVEKRRKWEADNLDPYPNESAPPATPGAPTQQNVSITPGNGRKGESGTSVSNG